MLVFGIKVYLDHLGVLNRAAQASHARVAPRSESPDRPGEAPYTQGRLSATSRFRRWRTNSLSRCTAKPGLLTFTRVRFGKGAISGAGLV